MNSKWLILFLILRCSKNSFVSFVTCLCSITSVSSKLFNALSQNIRSLVLVVLVLLIIGSGFFSFNVILDLASWTQFTEGLYLAAKFLTGSRYLFQRQVWFNVGLYLHWKANNWIQTFINCSVCLPNFFSQGFLFRNTPAMSYKLQLG